MPDATVVGLGAVVLDDQMLLARVPFENEKEHALATRQQIGGPVPTALALLRRFEHSCRLISPWGNDTAGDLIEQDLAREGIRFDPDCRSEHRQTGCAHVWIARETGTRTIVARQCSWDDFRLSAADQQALLHCRWLHLDGTGGDTAIQAAALVKQRGGQIFVDAGSPKAATEALVAVADVFSFPARFAQQFFGTTDVHDAGHHLLKRGAQAAICTQGEQGAIVFTPEKATTVPAFDVSTVDSTGAGDVFCGGVMAGLLQNKSLVEAVRLGAAAAAMKCRNIGNRSALPCPKTLHTWLSGNPPVRQKGDAAHF